MRQSAGHHGAVKTVSQALLPTANDAAVSRLLLRRLGLVDYAPTYAAMRRFSAERDANTPDELWLLQHPPVYTLGQAGKMEHLLEATEIPVEQTDRGGQITYHGPGQIILYSLIDLKRRALSIRRMVNILEQAIIDFLAENGIEAARRTGAPGVYVGNAKIAALGLRVRNGCCYHGIALNVDLDLAPFSNINPCGHAGLRVTRLTDLGVRIDCVTAGESIATQITRLLRLA